MSNKELACCILGQHIVCDVLLNLFALFVKVAQKIGPRSIGDATDQTGYFEPSLMVYQYHVFFSSQTSNAIARRQTSKQMVSDFDVTRANYWPLR